MTGLSTSSVTAIATNTAVPTTPTSILTPQTTNASVRETRYAVLGITGLPTRTVSANPILTITRAAQLALSTRKTGSVRCNAALLEIQLAAILSRIICASQRSSASIRVTLLLLNTAWTFLLLSELTVTTGCYQLAQCQPALHQLTRSTSEEVLSAARTVTPSAVTPSWTPRAPQSAMTAMSEELTCTH